MFQIHTNTMTHVFEPIQYEIFKWKQIQFSKEHTTTALIFTEI